MKKFFAAALAAVLVFATLSAQLSAFAAEPTCVYVSVSDGKGAVDLAQAAVSVTDIDADGKITVNDALFCAHEQYYPGGAAAGYATVTTAQYGMSLAKLWGVQQGSSYGYYINNASAWSMTDTLQADEYLYAFAYSDLDTFSDSYSFFDVQTVKVAQYETVSLTLLRSYYDYTSWAMETAAVAGATITVDGEETSVVTDAQGKATLTLNEGGTHVISAESAEYVLVPPVCTATVVPANLLATIMHFFRMILDFFKNAFSL